MLFNHRLFRFALLSIVMAMAPLSAGAALTQITDRAALGRNDVIDWADLGPAGTTVSNPFTISSVGGMVTDVSKPAPQGAFQVYYQTTGGWLGNFAAGDAVLWSQGDAGPIALEFAAPVEGAGAQLQMDSFGAFTGVVTAYDSGGNPLGEFSLDGEVIGDTGDGSAIFLGVRSDSADIARVEFWLEDGSSFGINDVDLVSPTSEMEIAIDVKPGDAENEVLAEPRLPFEVAILGSESLDVHDVDVATLAFGPGGAEPALDLTDPYLYSLALRDVNGDGETDLVAPFPFGVTGLPLGESEACLTGEVDGIPFAGCDTLVAVLALPSCGLGFELVIFLPPLIWLRARRRKS
jgi:hypothetical protein